MMDDEQDIQNSEDPVIEPGAADPEAANTAEESSVPDNDASKSQSSMRKQFEESLDKELGNDELLPQQEPFAKPMAPKPITPKPMPQKQPVWPPEAPVNLPTGFHQTPPIQPPVPKQPPAPVQPPAPTLTEPAVPKIPLQDFSASLERARSSSDKNLFTSTRTSPGYQPAKTVGFKPLVDVEEEKPAGKDLQSAVSSIISSDVGGKPPARPAAVINNPNIKPLRTYETDVAEVLEHTKASTASIALAESKRQRGEEVLSDKEEPTGQKSSGGGRKLLMALVSLILIGAGVIGAYYLYSLSPLAPGPSAPPSEQTVTSLIPADSHVGVAVDGSGPLEALSRLQSEISKPQTAGTIKDIVPVETRNGIVTRLTGPEMIRKMDIGAPDMLVRSLSDNWMLGSYAAPGGGKSVFVVVTTNFFQNAFAGMLQWEDVMADDLKQYIYPSAPMGIANVPANIPSMIDILNPLSTSTATSTGPAVQPYFTIRGTFKDRIIRNKDVRVFVTDQGSVLFLYSFLDNTKILMAGDESVMTEILSRLEKQSFIR